MLAALLCTRTVTPVVPVPGYLPLWATKRTVASVAIFRALFAVSSAGVSQYSMSITGLTVRPVPTPPVVQALLADYLRVTSSTIFTLLANVTIAVADMTKLNVYVNSAEYLNTVPPPPNPVQTQKTVAQCLTQLSTVLYDLTIPN